MRISLLARGETVRIIGIMSGTSHDGVDAALAEIEPAGERPKVRLLGHIHTPYAKSLRDEIHRAFEGSTELICRLNFRLGEVFADAALTLMESSGHRPSDIHAIASHGQTIHHIPPAGKKRGSTLQIGEAAVIAEGTGILTVSDFRPRDMAAMGHGAPLVPLADHILFGERSKRRAVLNIGGMANVTILTGELSETIAFDTGPGNSLMDEAIKICSSGKNSFDKNGSLARSGRPHAGLMEQLLSHPYFKKKPPKSTGRELFGSRMAEEILERFSHLSQADLLCSLCHLTTETISGAVSPFRPDEVIVTGGGMKNGFLMELLSKSLSEKGIRLAPISEYGIPPEAKEALSFAILGYRTLTQSPGNVPSATGARHGAILGKITLP